MDMDTFFGCHFCRKLQTQEDLSRFLEEVRYGPSGQRATASIGPADSNRIVLEFVLFEDCAFLWHDNRVAVEPAFLDADGTPIAPSEPGRFEVVENSLGDVESIPAHYLLCTPSWVREVVSAYAATGIVPEGIVWQEAPLLQETGSDRRYAGLPSWVGMFASGRGDLAERHKEILREILEEGMRTEDQVRAYMELPFVQAPDPDCSHVSFKRRSCEVGPFTWVTGFGYCLGCKGEWSPYDRDLHPDQKGQ